MYDIIEKFKENNCEYIRSEKIKNKTYYFYICNTHREDGIKKVRKDSFLKGAKCKKCADKKRSDEMRLIAEKEFRKFISNLNQYEIKSEYINANTHIDIYHSLCDKTFKVTPGHFKDGTRCPYCFGLYKTTEEFKKEVYELVQDEYTVLEDYKGTNVKIFFKHNICEHVYKVSPKKFLQNRRCPNCTDYRNSKLSIKIEDFLIKNNIKYYKEYSFDDCKNILRLLFDFAIFYNNKLYCLIEADGMQHFKPVDRFGGEEGFLKIKYRDNIKNEYCKNNNIKLIRISYKELNSIDEILFNAFDFLK